VSTSGSDTWLRTGNAPGVARRAGASGRKLRKAGPIRLHSLLVPMLVFLLLMVALPVLYAVWLSFTKFHFGSEPVFNGLDNYRTMFADPLFWTGLRLTFSLYAMALVMQLVFGVWLGLLLDRVRVLRRVVRTIMLSPFVMPPVVVAMMWVIILDPFQGAANYILQSLGLPQSGWLSSPPIVLPIFAMLDTWQAAPLVALLVLGGLQTLPQSVYEAAALDGASGYALLRYITLPLLIPTLVTVAVLRSVDLLRFFDLIYIITQGGPGDSSTTLNIYAFRRAFEFFDMGYASTLMIALSVTILGVIVCIVRLRRICDW
jgi:multiple sugar transport system permease protein